MAKTFRVGIISDQHIDRIHPESWEMAKAIYEEVARLKIDHVINNGDIFDSSEAMRRDQEAVTSYLKRLGLWHRDRSTLVPGNHDITNFPTYEPIAISSMMSIRRPISRSARKKFYDWAGELLDGDSITDEVFPAVKDVGPVRIIAMDVTHNSFTGLVQPAWDYYADIAVRSIEDGIDLVRILAIHGTAFQSDYQTKSAMPFKEFEMGFNPEEYENLENFVNNVGVKAVVCGHTHIASDYSWPITKNCRAYLAGRSGGLCNVSPTFTVLSISNRRIKDWKEVSL